MARAPKLDEKISGKLLNRLRDGEDPSVLIGELVEQGHARKRASRWVEALDDRVQAEHAGVVVRVKPTSKGMSLLGAVIMASGMGIWVITNENARPGGTFVIPTGMIIGGLSLMLRGLRR